MAITHADSISDNVLTSQDIDTRVAPNQLIHLEGKVSGSSAVVLAVKAWRQNSPEPDWQATYVDRATDRITSAGSVYAWSYLSRFATQKTVFKYQNARGLVPAAAPVDAKPSATTTGVPAGTALTPYYGDITVTRPGTHLDRLDIHGFVNVKAANVVISNSIVRGGVATFDRGLIQDYGYANLVIDHVYIEPEFPSVFMTGIKGSNFTASHVHVFGGTDSMQIFGDNVVVEDSLLEHTTLFSVDPDQHGGPSHSDNIQTFNGNNIIIQRNTIRDTSNFPILGAANHGDLTNFVVKGNWLDGGHCTLKLQALNGYTESATVSDNKFGPNRAIAKCPFQVTPGVDVNASANTFETTNLPVSILFLA